MGYKFDAQAVLNEILAKMAKYKADTSCEGVVLGMSGGKDSATVAMLVKKVFGDNVFALLLPDGLQKDIADAETAAQQIGVDYATVNIGAAVEAVLKNPALSVEKPAALNVPPRVRMLTLYAAAQARGWRVAGTGNLSEAYTGWFTKYGDGGYDFNPIGNLTKTEVVAVGTLLAREFGLDAQRYIDKRPADGLTGKSDEENFGFTYATLDNYIRTGLCADAHIKDKIDSMHRNSRHKREMPPLF
ncbi:MAG: NAD(+) synthase [Clostridiales bacterium]|jgi:NAD+ synthase|nr:NAD(+) synthase [Clostridiales bacterium]